MRRRIILSGIFSFLALSGAVRPAQAGEFAYGCGHWGYCAPCVPFGLFFYGSRLGLGTGFPGLRPYPGWHHPVVRPDLSLPSHCGHNDRTDSGTEGSYC